MIVTYTLSADDTQEALFRRNRRVLAHVKRYEPGERLDRVLSGICLCLLRICLPMIFVGSIYPAITGITPYGFLAFISGIMMALLGYAFLKKRSVKGEQERLDKNPELAGPFSTELTDAGLTHIAPGWSTTIEWRAIRTIAETRSLLLITESTPRTIIVPKRAFAEPEDEKRFIATIEVNLNSSFKQ